MLYAKWNNKVIDAESVAETEASETLVRKVSGIELLCVDPNCDHPLVGYKHGPSRRPHFFHLVNGNCDYAAFERTDNSLVREARNSLYHHFRDIGYNVEREQKLPDGKKYCHLLFHIDKRDIVLQIAQPSTTARYINSFTTECERSGYELKWIVLGHCYDYQSEKHNYHVMRYLFNHSANKDLLVLDIETEKISQTKYDNTLYTYKGYSLKERLDYDIEHFSLIKDIDSLILFDGEPALKSFHEAYKAWQCKKQEEFEKMKQNIDERERMRDLTAVSQKTLYGNLVKNPFSNLTPVTPIHNNHGEHTIGSIIKQYVLGTRILHNFYGIGYITEISLLSTHKHKIRVRYNNTLQSHELEFLIEHNLIRIL